MVESPMLLSLRFHLRTLYSPKVQVCTYTKLLSGVPDCVHCSLISSLGMRRRSICTRRSNTQIDGYPVTGICNACFFAREILRVFMGGLWRLKWFGHVEGDVGVNVLRFLVFHIRPKMPLGYCRIGG